MSAGANEAVELGVARVAGTTRAKIVEAAPELLTAATAYARMARGGSPYGDGRSAARIVEAIRAHFEPLT